MLGYYRTKPMVPAPPPEKPTEWWGWRKLRGTFAAWEHFAEANAPTRGECYTKLMGLSELSRHEGDYSYLILPAKQRPPL